MQSYIYQTRVDYQPVDNVLDSIRDVVQDLKDHHPELHDCSLADVGFLKRGDSLDITLYFQPK